MAKTPSNMLPLGTIAPDFSLQDVSSGKDIQLKNNEQYPATVIMFICNHCPYVKHINPAMTQVANDYMPKGIRFIAISSNDVIHYPEDSPEHMKEIAQEEQYPFPYLYDETQEVAHSYQAACTPDFYVFNSQLALVYRGQFDDSRPGNSIPVSGNSLREALDCILSGSAVTSEQKASLGCNIKWKNTH